MYLLTPVRRLPRPVRRYRAARLTLVDHYVRRTRAAD